MRDNVRYLTDNMNNEKKKSQCHRSVSGETEPGRDGPEGLQRRSILTGSSCFQSEEGDTRGNSQEQEVIG